MELKATVSRTRRSIRGFKHRVRVLGTPMIRDPFGGIDNENAYG